MRLLLLLLLLLPGLGAFEATFDDAGLKAAVTVFDGKSKSEKEAALEAIRDLGDPRYVPVLEAYAKGMLAIQGDRVVIYESRLERDDGSKVYPVIDALSGEPLLVDGQPVLADGLPSDLVRARSSERRLARAVTQQLLLHDPDLDRRMAAIIKVADNGEDDVLDDLRGQLAGSNEDALSFVLSESIARIELAGDDEVVRIAAAQSLGEMRSLRAHAHLSELATDEQASKALRWAASVAVNQIEDRQEIVRGVGHVFSGLSLASILILLALGLAITFGLMGVINMAHGEMMMVGAYTTWAVSNAFAAWFPSLFDWYLVVAIPMAFLVSAGVGMFLEWAVIRHLYKRPLETLLATWGVSLILIQAIRVCFGDLQSVTPPTWLSGSWSIGFGIELPTNRLFIIAFCACAVVLVYLLMNKTRMGLLIRATTQNRNVAATLGVNTRKIDMFCFGFGSGLAGLAGVVVPFVDKINPQMGQGYIVDSFLVVVTGGVGNLLGVLCSGLGLGMVTKFIEPWLEAVFTKVSIMALIIVFLQMRPAGLFPAKGRLAEA